MRRTGRPTNCSLRHSAAWRRLGAEQRLLAGYIAFFTVALLIFDVAIVLSLSS